MVSSNFPLTLRVNTYKYIGFLALTALVTLAGWYGVKAGEKGSWFIVCLFGLGSIVSLLQLIPNASYLKITDDGIESSTFFRPYFVP